MIITFLLKAGKVKRVTVKTGRYPRLINGRSSGFGNRRMGDKGYSKQTINQEIGTRKKRR